GLALQSRLATEDSSCAKETKMLALCFWMFAGAASNAVPPSDVTSADVTSAVNEWRNAVAWRDNFKVHVTADLRSFDGQGKERESDYRKWEYDVGYWAAQNSYQARCAGTLTYNAKTSRFVHLRTQYDGEDKFFVFQDGGVPWAFAYRNEPEAMCAQHSLVPEACFGLGAVPVKEYGVPKPLDLFAPETTTVAQEAIDGIDCQVLSTETPYGDLSVWLAPSYGYNPVKLRIVKESGKDIWPDGRIFNEPIITDDGRNVPAQTCTIEIVTTKFTEVNGRFTPAETKFAIQRHGTENELTTVYSVSYSQPDLSPNFNSSSFMPDFPDGTIIWFNDDREIVDGFEWRNGKIMPAIDEKALANVSRVATGISPVDAPPGTTQQTLNQQDLSGMSEAVAPLRPDGRRYHYLGLAVVGGIVLLLSGLLRIRQKT
ncbi:MAG: hypothetical protein NTZ09_00860, partial [Candidatus Hydrogenedentes bacterium]|nr:hypothetical protein [Candidatus Hydrogenedentota bacterium]